MVKPWSKKPLARDRFAPHQYNYLKMQFASGCAYIKLLRQPHENIASFFFSFFFFKKIIIINAEHFNKFLTTFNLFSRLNKLMLLLFTSLLSELSRTRDLQRFKSNLKHQD